MRIASLHLHPLKSCAQLDVDRLEITPRGPAGDRRWLIVDAEGRFVTARQRAEVVGIRASPTARGVRLEACGREPIEVPFPLQDAPRREVSIWRDRVQAQVCDPASDAWLSAWLGIPVHLVHMDDAARRAVDPDHGQPGDLVSFADAYPLLLITQAALDGLNSRLARPVRMSRFRPNIVVERAEAHAEDAWRRVRIGGIEFDAVKACTRCVFTTIDPTTLTRDPGGEPLRTLTGYRRTPAGVTFGMNLIPRGTGPLRVGDAVEVLG
ncbi:MAG: MOSC domain-containing protein [Lysobacter sp.]|nr:MOSC domain-containing protein [Lysobacter sp.]MDQ3270270.1 MOSC domain-containing protein [Pseudomonadota bacterium]